MDDMHDDLAKMKAIIENEKKEVTVKEKRDNLSNSYKNTNF